MLRTANFTIVQHEPFFFPLWLDYYLRFFDPADIWVIHHALPAPASDEESARKEAWETGFRARRDEVGFNVLDVQREASFDHEWLRQVVCQFQRRLLAMPRYDATLFTEVDEIVATDPRSRYGTDLNAYIEANLPRKTTCVCNGFEVVHKIDEEPRLDPGSRPLLRQRGWWYWNKMYSKPLLSTVPLDWCWGFHACNQHPVPYRFKDDDLLLLHLHKLDYEICRDRHVANAARRWADGVFGFQNRIVEEGKLKRWWYNHIDMNRQDAVLVAIPGELQSIV